MVFSPTLSYKHTELGGEGLLKFPFSSLRWNDLSRAEFKLRWSHTQSTALSCTTVSCTRWYLAQSSQHSIYFKLQILFYFILSSSVCHIRPSLVGLYWPSVLKKNQFSGHIWHQKRFLKLNEAPHTNHLHKIYHMCIIPDVYYCIKHTEPVCSKSNNSSLIEAIFII